MPRLLLPALLLAVALFAAACQETAAPEPEPQPEPQVAPLKIGFIDQEAVFRDSKPGQEGMDILGSLNNALMTEMSEARSAAETAEAEGDEEAMARASEEFQAKVGQLQQRMQMEQERILIAITKGYHQALSDYREANGISVVFPAEQAAAFDKDLDITAGVIELLDNAGIDLSAPTEPEAAEDSAVGAEAEQQ